MPKSLLCEFVTCLCDMYSFERPRVMYSREHYYSK